MKSKPSKSKELGRIRSFQGTLPIYPRGQLMVLFALAAVTLVGVMALGADVGVLYYNWGELQKAADAAALAGANSLPHDPTLFVSTAKAYATDNGVGGSDVVTAKTLPAAPATPNEIQVTIQRTVPYSFMRALGFTNGYVAVSAIAAPPQGICTVNAGPTSPIACNSADCTTTGGTNLPASSCPVGGPTGATCPGAGGDACGTPFPPSGTGCGTSTGQYNVLPIAVSYKTAASWSYNTSYTLNRMDSGGNGPWIDAPGNWGFIDLCGSTGGSALRSSIANGYYGELTIGNTVTTQTGVSNGNVSKGLQGLLDRAPSSSSVPNGSDFNNPPDPRAVIIPMVNFEGCTGKCTVPIYGFMAFYINSVDTSTTNGNGVKGVINGTFIAMVDPNSTPSINAPNAGAAGDVVLLH